MIAPWFDPVRFGAYYGGIGGGVVGIIGGLLGALGGRLAPKGQARGLILGGFALMVGLGAIHLVVGLFAVISGQPYGIWYPLVLLGIIMTAVFGGLRPVIRKRYQEAQQRGMQANSVSRG